MATEARKIFRYKLGLNQPAHSPTAERMAEMAAAIERETDGGFVLEVHAESRLGPDPQMFGDVQKGALEFYLSGATLGGIAPSSALPMMPFAFKSSKAVFAALDGGLGRVIRSELARSGLFAFPHSLQNGFHHITTSKRPINTASDFDRLKIRTPGGAIATDFFQTLRADPGMVPFSGMYDALKTRKFDGQSDPLGVVQSLKLDEVQTYLSMTWHWWSGFTLLAHAAAWNALPADIRWVTERNVESFAKRQRADVERINAEGEQVLAERGMIVNHAEIPSIRGRLGDFYTRWKAKFPPTTWRQFEAHADGLG
ncbi:MAG TPA: TRAP transporter substrate-binding protein DctP [Stellaceae bacterium]|jgi:TRAP-type C4-dicarboxylate transport system substrate-binding protein|nr:TRAP transporter substrate-binding protein DctP [Stellaceae bacterium]